MYNYETEKHYVFSEEGQVAFLKIRDNVKKLLKISGAFKLGKSYIGINFDTCPNSWERLACIDRLVELGEIKELTDSNVAGQCRVFTDE